MSGTKVVGGEGRSCGAGSIASMGEFRKPGMDISGGIGRCIVGATGFVESSGLDVSSIKLMSFSVCRRAFGCGRSDMGVERVGMNVDTTSMGSEGVIGVVSIAPRLGSCSY